MFKVSRSNQHKIISDQGFTFEFPSRNVLEYNEAGISLLIDIDGDGKVMDVIATSIRVRKPQEHLPSKTALKVITSNIASALEWRGWKVRIIR